MSSLCNLIKWVCVFLKLIGRFVEPLMVQFRRLLRNVAAKRTCLNNQICFNSRFGKREVVGSNPRGALDYSRRVLLKFNETKQESENPQATRTNFYLTGSSLKPSTGPVWPASPPEDIKEDDLVERGRGRWLFITLCCNRFGVECTQSISSTPLWIKRNPSPCQRRNGDGYFNESPRGHRLGWKK